MRRLEGFLSNLQDDPKCVKLVREYGIGCAVAFMECETIKDFSNFGRLVTDGKVHQLWVVSTMLPCPYSSHVLQMNLADGSYVRFSLDGWFCFGQGTFTMQQGFYSENGYQECCKLVGDSSNFSRAWSRNIVFFVSVS